MSIHLKFNSEKDIAAHAEGVKRNPEFYDDTEKQVDPVELHGPDGFLCSWGDAIFTETEGRRGQIDRWIDWGVVNSMLESAFLEGKAQHKLEVKKFMKEELGIGGL